MLNRIILEPYQRILEKYNDAIIVTNTKCKEFLSEFLPLNDAKFRVVGDGDSLDLGGKTLKFIITPWCTGQILWLHT